jgi:hypothetical protein
VALAMARAPLAAALILAVAAGTTVAPPSAAARSPSVRDERSMDFVREEIRRSREAERSAGDQPVASEFDKWAADYGSVGQLGIGAWRTGTDTIVNREAKQEDRQKAADKIVERFRAEQAAGKTPSKTIENQRKTVGKVVLNLLQGSNDPVGVTVTQSLLSGLFPGRNITCSPNDPLAKRMKAYKDWGKVLD